LEDFALSVLGITEQDLFRVEEEKRNKKEYIRKVIASSDPSFGRFMTQVYDYHQRLRESGGGGASKSLLRMTSRAELLETFRQKVSKDNFSQEELCELCFILYKMSVPTRRP
jgi:hypothetical protein